MTTVAVVIGFNFRGRRARAAARLRTAARIARRRQGNCRKSSSGAWFQSEADRGVRRRVMAMVRIARVERRTIEWCAAVAFAKYRGLSTAAARGAAFGRD